MEPEPERWQRIERLYHAALEREPGRRAAFIQQASEGDESIALEVESLLANSEETNGFLEAPAVNVAAKSLAAEWGARPHPATIGSYRIVRVLGEGGMGTVYEAEQENPRRVVALKVIKLGLTTSDRLRRFRHESQALARLQHPGIAQIYESNTADTGFGLQPYLVMEFIRGMPLHRYAEVHRLDDRQRLALTTMICDAVHHAHQRGLIHRDLKPANILVDAAGQPKILDFGVARVSEPDAESEGELSNIQTRAGQLVGTLAYMSPEQVAGDSLEVDARSDVYSLGVVFYELLSGRLPYDVSGQPLPDAVQTIRDEDPVPLSSMDRRYRGDIENIIGKALEKEKARRYGSAAELAADIQRYLKNEPIAARPASIGYQLQKFARRNRSLVLAAAIVFVVLLAGVVATSSQAIRATRAGKAALQQRDRAAAAERTATQERDRARLAESDAKQERNRAVAAEATASEQRNRALAQKLRADDEAATAKAVSDFLRNDLLAQASLSAQSRPGARPDPDLKVRTALDRAAARIDGRFDKQPKVEVAVRQTIGTTYLDLGLYAEAQVQFEKTYEIRRRALGKDDPDTLTSINNLAALYMDQGKRQQAEPLLAEALEIRTRALGEENPATLVTLNNLAGLYRMEGKYPEAERLYAKGLAIRRRVLGENDRSTALTMHNLASLYRVEGKYADAEPLQTRALEIWRAVIGAEAPETLQAMNNLAAIDEAVGKYAEAEDLWSKVLEVRRRALGAQHPNTSDAMGALAEVELLQKKYVQAEPLARELLSNWEKTNAGTWKPYFAQALLGASLSGQMSYTEAEPLLVSAEQGLDQRQSTIPVESRGVLARSREWVLQLYESWGQTAKASEWREKLKSK